MTGFSASFNTPGDCFNQKIGIGNFVIYRGCTKRNQITTTLQNVRRIKTVHEKGLGLHGNLISYNVNGATKRGIAKKRLHCIPIWLVAFRLFLPEF